MVAATSLVARLPKGMVPLATVLLLHQSAGSYAIAGIAVALTALGDAASAPAQGWLADRFGCGRVLIPTAAVHVAAVAALLLLVRDQAPVAAVIACAGLAGIGLPPVSGSIKAAWPRLAGPADLAALTAGGLAGAFGPVAAAGQRRYLRLCWLFAAALLPAAALGVRPSAVSLLGVGAVLAVAGLLVTPIAAISYVLLEQATTSAHRTEAFTWLSTGLASGTAVGAAVAGVLVSAASPAAALTILPAVIALSALVAGARGLGQTTDCGASTSSFTGQMVQPCSDSTGHQLLAQWRHRNSSPWRWTR